MEHLHILLNGIDTVKEHMSDVEYLKMMDAIGKLSQIINSQDDSDNYSESYYSDNESEISEDDEEVSVLDIDMLLETINNNEIVFNNFMKENNLSDDFKLSKFNVINQSAFNYVTHNTCKCCDENEICYENIDNLYNCKNYQSFILKFPAIHLFVKRNCEGCNETIIEDINKYKLFEFDGKIKFNDINKDTFANFIRAMISITNNIEGKYQIILFFNIFHFLFNYGNILLQEKKLKLSIYNKLLSEKDKHSMKEYSPYWANVLYFDKNIYNRLIESLEAL